MVLVDCLGEMGLGYLDQCVCVCLSLVYGEFEFEPGFPTDFPVNELLFHLAHEVDLVQDL